MIVRTGRFAIHLNAYVEYLAGRVGPGARDASEEGRPHDLDPDLVTKLEGCSDDRCAKAAFTGTREIEGLDGYLRETWPRDSDDARRAVGRSGTPLMELEDVIAPALASQIGRTWPNEPIDVYLARAPEIDPSGREGSLIDTEGECFGGRALLECLFTRAVEVLLPESDLGRGIDEARAALDALSRTKTDAAALCVAALAVDAAVGAADAGYRPTRRFSEACAPSLRPWLGDSWAKRIRGDLGAREFGAKLVEAMASQRP